MSKLLSIIIKRELEVELYGIARIDRQNLLFIHTKENYVEKNTEDPIYIVSVINYNI